MNTAETIGVFTNVPGPRRPIHVAGAEVKGLFGWGGVAANQILTLGS